MIEGLVSALSLSPPTAPAASWALRWLNKNQGWRPTRTESDLILSIAKDPVSEPLLVRNLLLILGQEHELRSVELLIDRLVDDNAELRATAAVTLGQIGDLRAVEPLIAGFDETDSTVREAIAEALGQIGDLRAIEPLIARLCDENSVVRKAAAVALGKIGDARAVDPLIAKVDDETLSVRRAAAVALGQLGDSRAVNSLIVRLDDEDSEVRQIAATGLGHIKNPLLFEALTERLSGNDRVVRDNISHAFSALAIRRFNEGDVGGAADVYDVLISKAVINKPTDEYRNNRAYCLMLLGRYPEAAAEFSSMDFPARDSNWPLYQHNHAVLTFLMGDETTGRQLLEASLEWIVQAGKEYDPRALCMLLLKDRTGITSNDDLPVDAAVLLNLYAMGSRTAEQLSAELSKRYPGEYENWMAQVLPAEAGEG